MFILGASYFVTSFKPVELVMIVLIGHVWKQLPAKLESVGMFHFIWSV